MISSNALHVPVRLNVVRRNWCSKFFITLVFLNDVERDVRRTMAESPEPLLIDSKN